VSFYVSTATFFLLHCDEWDRVVALPRHENDRVVTIGKHSRLNRQIWYRHLNSEAGNDEIQNFQRGDFYFVGITF
jgi:hypothetical protein